MNDIYSSGAPSRASPKARANVLAAVYREILSWAYEQADNLDPIATVVSPDALTRGGTASPITGQPTISYQTYLTLPIDRQVPCHHDVLPDCAIETEVGAILDGQFTTNSSTWHNVADRLSKIFFLEVVGGSTIPKIITGHDGIEYFEFPAIEVRFISPPVEKMEV